MTQHVLAQTAFNDGRGGPIGLVIAPARELAIQIFVAAHPFFIDNCRPDRQTLMFSATFGSLPEKFARKALNNPLK
uniref:Uncharacterized protein n=1 Tax=Panagrolaimus davidi TaxID=227884 RepID=A0A914Q1R0_9BILA